MGSWFSSNKSCSNEERPISNSVPTLTHLVSSSTASAIAVVILQPLEVLKIKLQTNVMGERNIRANIRHIYKAEGRAGLFRGLFLTLATVVPSNTLYYTSYNLMKTKFGPTGERAKDTMNQSISAGVASIATAAITNPLWVLKTRTQAQPMHRRAGVTKGAVNIARSIWKEDGWKGFYKGIRASFLTSSQAMLQFPMYEMLKSLLCSKEHDFGMSTVTLLLSSSISASLAHILTYPTEVVRARLQAQHGPHRKYEGIFHAFKKIWAMERLAGYYKGLGTSLIKMTPSHAISLTTYEFIVRFLTSYDFHTDTNNTNFNIDTTKTPIFNSPLLPAQAPVKYSLRAFNFTNPQRNYRFRLPFPLPSKNNYKYFPITTPLLYITANIPFITMTRGAHSINTSAYCIHNEAIKANINNNINNINTNNHNLVRWSEYLWRSIRS